MSFLPPTEALLTIFLHSFPWFPNLLSEFRECCLNGRAGRREETWVLIFSGRCPFLCHISRAGALSLSWTQWRGERIPWHSSHGMQSWSPELWRKASELFAKCWCLVNTKLHLGNSLLLPVILHFYSWHRHLNQRTVTFQRLWRQFGYVPTL